MKNTYYYGGTYDREQTHHKIDDSAVEKLTNALAEFYPNDFEVTQVKFGFRPTVKTEDQLLELIQNLKFICF